jgi:hypothetical protein
MPRPLPILALALLVGGCAVHRAKSDAQRAWVDVSLDEPMEPSRVLAFLASYDPVMVGDRAVVPPTVVKARAWLDAHRTESRHWIDELVQANERFEPGDLPQATADLLCPQLGEVVLELGPIIQDQPGWPVDANPYPWPVSDGELRRSLFGLYLQTGRLCPDLGGDQGNMGWSMAARLLALDPSLTDAISRPTEREALEALR